jgi:hypothetical protein
MKRGDGVLFGSRGRDRLQDPGAMQFFMLGMVQCVDKQDVSRQLAKLRGALQGNPLYASICRVHDVDDRTAAKYGSYLTRKVEPPDPEKIKSRWI